MCIVISSSFLFHFIFWSKTILKRRFIRLSLTISSCGLLRRLSFISFCCGGLLISQSGYTCPLLSRAPIIFLVLKLFYFYNLNFSWMQEAQYHLHYRRRTRPRADRPSPRPTRRRFLRRESSQMGVHASRSSDSLVRSKVPRDSWATDNESFVPRNSAREILSARNWRLFKFLHDSCFAQISFW